MRLQPIIKYISKFLEPTRVFIALMLAVGMWLFPFISFKEKTITPIEHGVIVSADPFTAGAIGECADVHCEPGYCCVKGYCKTGADNCADDDPPPPSPPTISANLNCSDWGDNGWCKGSLSIDLSAADPQGQAVVISGTVNGSNFACPSGATSCSIPLSGEGIGSVSYQVNSATGLSAAGSLGYQIDLTSPDLDTSVSGAAGTNGWYRSDVTLGVSASDATSGIASITASINGGGATSVGGSLTFSDGEYSVLIVARDNAGHVTQDTQIINVDTITPSLSFTTGGTNGKNGWYVSSASAAATASDAGSDLASIEASVDGGAWTVSDSISLGDGVHTYQFRATDVAGNKTETPTQTALVDTIAPSISMSQGTSLGEKVLYEIEDYGSGLSIFRAVIEDDDEAYQKVTWSGDISGSYIADDILWDGKFTDGTKAGIGEYMVTLKITDAAGNKAIKTTFVTVGLLGLLDDIPAFSPPVSSTSEEEDDVTPSDVVSAPISFGGIPTTTEIGEYVTTNTSVPSITIPTTNIPIDPNILWGAAATAMVGATLADWQRKREEEERARREREATSNAGRYAAIAKAYNASRKNFTAYLNKAKEMGMSDAEVAKLKKNVNDTGKIGASLDTTKSYIVQKQANILAADAARWAGAAGMAQAKQQAAQQSTNEKMPAPILVEAPVEEIPFWKFWDKNWNGKDAWNGLVGSVFKSGNASMPNLLNLNLPLYSIIPKQKENSNYFDPFNNYLEHLRNPTDESKKFDPFVLNIPKPAPMIIPAGTEIKTKSAFEWVHNILDIVGFIPGIGDLADGVNGLIYLGEGRKVEATISAVAMIPILGDLGKWTFKVGGEIVEVSAEAIVKTTFKEAAENAAKEALEKIAKESLEEGLEKAAREAAEEALEKISKEYVEAALEKAVKESVGIIAKDVAKEIAEKALRNFVETNAERVAKEATQEYIEKVTKEFAEKEASPVVIRWDTRIMTGEAIDEVAEKFYHGEFGEIVMGQVAKFPDDIIELLKISPDEITKVFADKISELTKSKFYMSKTSGVFYISKTPDEALVILKDLKKLVTAVGDTRKIADNVPSNILERIKELARYTLRGTGNRAVIGSYPKYIENALDNGNTFFDVGEEGWSELVRIFGESNQSGIFLVNEQFFNVLEDYGVKSVELISDLNKPRLPDGILETIELSNWINEFNKMKVYPWEKMSYGQMEALALETSSSFTREVGTTVWNLK